MDQAMEVCGGQSAEDVSGGIDLDAAETNLRESPGQPLGARLLAVSGRRNRDELNLPVHDGFGIGVQPGEGSVNRPLRGEGCDARERRG